MASVEIIVADLHIPQSRSLKDKRRVLKSLIDRSYQRFRLSVAETAFHELHQRAQLTFAIVLTGSGSRAEELRRYLEQDPACLITQWNAEIVDLV